MPQPFHRARPFAALFVHRALVVAGAVVLPGCGLLRTAAETPGRVAEAVLPPGQADPASAEQVLGEMLRYSDLLMMRADQALADFEATVGTREAELQATQWRLNLLRWATQIAAGPSALTSLLDMLVVVTAQRWMFEDYWIPEVWGEAAEPLRAALALTEEDGWALVERYMTPEQFAEARALLRGWREEHPRLERDSLVAFPSFMSLAESEEDPRVRGLFDAFGLDPLSGLEPAARELALARQLGQRALFVLQRAPRILGAELELRMHDAHTEVTEVADELAADLGAVSGPVGELLGEARATLEVSEDASGEITGAIEAFDELMERFDDSAEPGEPGRAPAEADAPPGKPFDVTEYGEAAAQIGAAAQELTTLLVELDERLPEARALLSETAARGTATVDRALRGLLLVGLALIAAAALVAWLVRRRSRARRFEPAGHPVGG